MTSYYTFNEIIEDVRTDVGFSNMRNLYSQIRQLIARAEEEINPFGGYLVRKRMIFFKGNGNFDGKNIKIPSDFVKLDENMMCKDGMCGSTLLRSESHITICDRQIRDRVPLSYWALNCDGEGNPIISRNHKEAVVNFIVFKLYSGKVFNGEGSAQLRREYKQEWEDSCMAARGFDMFPTMKSLEKIHNLATMSQMQMNEQYRLDHCTLTECDMIFQEMLNTPVTAVNDLVDKIHVFQFDKPGKVFKLEEITDKFLKEKSLVYNRANFIQGIPISFAHTGKFGFVVENAKSDSVKIIDVLGNDINSSMDIHNDYINKRIIFVSKNYISPSTIFFKITSDA